MFRPVDGLTQIPARATEVVALYHSINQPQVHIHGVGTEAASAVIAGVRTDAGFRVYVHLYAAASEQGALFLSDGGDVSLVAYANLEAEAIEFVENMGFLLENDNFRGLPSEEQAQLHASLPTFGPPAAPASAAPASAAQAPSAAPAMPEPAAASVAAPPAPVDDEDPADPFTRRRSLAAHAARPRSADGARLARVLSSF